MKTLTTQEIAAAVGGTAQVQDVITDVCTDNRAVHAGCLFVCIKGERFDGHTFARSALEQGANAVLCSRDLGLGRQILVPDTRAALLALARYYRGLFAIPFNFDSVPDFTTRGFNSFCDTAGKSNMIVL